MGLLGRSPPVWFVGDSVEDPNTLPLTFGEILPLNGVINVRTTSESSRPDDRLQFR